MPAKKKASARSRSTRFSAKRQPKKKGARAVKAKPGTGRWNERAVWRLAEKGVESADIARHLKLIGRLQKDQVLRAKFAETVENGHATHRVQIAEVMKAEAKKGKSNALRDEAKAWIARYSDEVLTGEDEAGIIARIRGLVDRLKGRNVAPDAV